MKRILPLLLILLLILTGCSAQNADSPAADAPTDTPLTGTSYVQIDVKDYGTIVAELYADTAPITVANFLSLVDSGFYDGLTFHRIISGFMIQGGDPNGNGTGGSSQRIKGEFSANGVQNDLKHTRGVLSMARSSAMDSASSQFFIMHADAPHLDGQYAAFGKITDNAQAAVDISRVNRDMFTDKPKKPQTIKSIRVDTQGVEYPAPEKH